MSDDAKAEQTGPASDSKKKSTKKGTGKRRGRPKGSKNKPKPAGLAGRAANGRRTRKPARGTTQKQLYVVDLLRKDPDRKSVV